MQGLWWMVAGIWLLVACRWFLVTGFALGGWRFEVGGLSIPLFSLKPQTSHLKLHMRLPLIRIGHRADHRPGPLDNHEPLDHIGSVRGYCSE
jgi:hypothetical protein